MMTRLITAALLGALSLTACAQAPQPGAAAAKPAAAKPAPTATAGSGSAEDRARAAIAKLNPRAKVEYVGAAPLPGFREVIAGGQLLYVSDDGRYLMQGAVLDLEQQEDLMQNSVALAGYRSKLIATNIDPNCPTSHGLRPGCGAIVAMLETATGLKAFSVGKPSPVMMRAARKEIGLATDETIMIGDTMETDILGGVSMGYRTALVLTGSTKREDLKRYAYRPDLVLDSIGDLCDEQAYAEAVGSLLEVGEPREAAAA